jgi:hypothetical protein
MDPHSQYTSMYLQLSVKGRWIPYPLVSSRSKDLFGSLRNQFLKIDEPLNRIVFTPVFRN